MFQRLRNLINFSRAAQAKQDPVVPASTFVAGMALVNGLLGRKPVCTRCFSVYAPKAYEFAERFRVRSILAVPDALPDPMLCDSCFNSVMQEYNRQSPNVGTSNASHSNLVLHRYG
jgi:hypothetical protein